MTNENTPHHHRLSYFLFLTGAFILLIGLTMIAPINVSNTKAFGVSEIVELTNQMRLQMNKKELRSNTRLMSAAQMKAEDMAKQRYFAHTAPDGTVAWDYFSNVGYIYEIAGENLAITNENAEAVIDGWLNSPAHRDNLLSSQFVDFGIGMARFGEYRGHQDTFVVVALYGRSAANQSLTASTVPAGISSALKPKFMTISPTIIAIISGILMLAGVYFEIRHIQRLHKSKNFASV